MSGPEHDASAGPGGSARILELHDVEILRRAALGAGWTAEYRQLGAGPLTVRSRVVQCAGISLVSQSADRSLEVVGVPPSGVLTVMNPASSDGFLINGYSIGENELIVLAPDAGMYAVTRPSVTICAIHIPWSLVEGDGIHTAFSRPGFERGWVIPVPDRELGSLRKLAFTAGRSPSEEAGLEFILTRTILPLINESNDVASNKGRHGGDQRWEVLSRARAFIEDHVYGTIRMADLCRHVGASASTVGRVFRQELQMTPTAYIRVRRLNAVKRELVGEGKADKSITEIAMSCGFGHLGRFSVAYREHFGHSPGEALKIVASSWGR